MDLGRSLTSSLSWFTLASTCALIRHRIFSIVFNQIYYSTWEIETQQHAATTCINILVLFLLTAPKNKSLPSQFSLADSSMDLTVGWLLPSQMS